MQACGVGYVQRLPYKEITKYHLNPVFQIICLVGNHTPGVHKETNEKLLNQASTKGNDTTGKYQCRLNDPYRVQSV